ncbi:C_GCAxxG_C_C family probable redox protein [Desulfotomaculum arcticum]|uniref:C_GCAxxG_C_C family probable redox protein n=1 Tax=Desulfotruncus arcticus DSM 17038 TaxID=1121424 RepID=A0A1I2XNQ2_9FIRM|nr:C-GCAxxG-C-C family protein [Desulfotruncus arcticus]SFH14737.1 C_GCAxxG_C_C family probable redox protein [Desulfotomaculum arcticum] [Desulfotruncus arcticus DSM 17038]
MNDSNKAIMMVKNGLQCSQAVLANLGEQLDVERKQALRLASGFGGGIALQGDICGAVSGAIMAIGLKHGYDEGPNVNARDKVYFLAQELIQRIKAKHGCYTCRGLTGMEMRRPESLKLFHEQGIPEKICFSVIRDSVEITEEIW